MNKKITVLGGLLMAVVMTAYSVSGTYAKYTSTFTGSDSARVAKWAFSINDTAATTNQMSFDLFKTINDTLDGNSETDVAKKGETINGTEITDNLIAPGTKGSFAIKLQNNSEVNAKYSIALAIAKTDENIPLEFCTTACDSEDNWESDITKLNITDVAMNMGADATTTIQWRWVFERGTGDEIATNDVSDTTLGAKGTDTITVTATVTATQVD